MLKREYIKKKIPLKHPSTPIKGNTYKRIYKFLFKICKRYIREVEISNVYGYVYAH